MKLELRAIIKKLEKISKQEKTPIYAVGGFVRDKILGKKDFKDLDFVVEGSGIAFAKAVDKEFGELGRLVEFSDFDTARYLFIDRSIESEEKILLELEFAGARGEIYEKNSRKPKVASVNLKTDLSRRDFTVNALALPIGAIFKRNYRNFVVDEFNGLKDLKNKTLKTPLEPSKTFSDDPLRMLRALRFASQLEFAIEPKALEAVFKNKNRIKIISAERIKEEMTKLLATKQPSWGLILLFQTGLLDLILPEVSALDGVEEIFGHNHKNNLVHTFKVVDNIAERSDNVLLRWAGLFHDIGKTIDRSIEGPHSILGYEIAKRCKEHPIVCNAIGSHHDEIPMEHPIAVLVQAADAISGARPGARREPLESYVKRLENLEEIAKSFEGVAKTYAIQAGREIRVVVEPDKVDDNFSDRLANDIAQKIQEEMEYPGQIKINVIRERRSIAYAK